jgi:hypothetical protein
VACEPLKYSGVDDAKWVRVRDLVGREYDIGIESDTGEASKKGFTLSWIHDADQQTLEIQCLKKPFRTAPSTIASRGSPTVWDRACERRADRPDARVRRV